MARRFCSLLLTATALAGAAPASAQADDLAALRAQVEALQIRVAQLEREREDGAATVANASAPRAAATVAAPAAASEEPPQIRFRGAPQITAAGGWSFKPRGRLQYDAGHVSAPDGVSEPGLGFSNELRRARLGVEGQIPGGFGYVFEVDFAGERVEVTDAILTYDAAEALRLTVGQHNNFQSLEEITSSRFSSFVERAAFTDAFNFERRLGISGTLTSGDLIAQAGVFTDNVQDLDDSNEAVSGDARLVYAPMIGRSRLHLGGSVHWRDGGDVATLGATRYRQRPLIHSTDVRFIETPGLSVNGETSYGLEAALVRGPLHAAAEAHWLEADTPTPGFSPNFFGAYAEIGYFLTGETRGYRGGRWDRTTVARSVEEGGIGAFQLNFRYDYLNLNSQGVVGGIQNGWQAGLTWIPTDYVRFLINYARLSYDDAVIAAAGGDMDYSVDVIGARAQIDF